MKKIFCVLSMLIFLEISAGEKKFRSKLEGEIYHYSVQHAYFKANTQPSDKNFRQLLDFIAYMRPDEGVSKSIKKALVFGQKLNVKGRDVGRILGQKLQARALEIKDDRNLRERLYIYCQLADLFSDLDEQLHIIMDDARSSGFNINLAHLYKVSESPEIFDEEEENRRLALEVERQRRDDEEHRRISGSEEEETIDEEDFESLLQNNKMTLAYSETSAIAALNEMIHSMYWLGVRFEYNGIRLSHLGPLKATNGAVFYKSVLPRPEKETHVLANKSVRDILEHMCETLNLQYALENNTVKISDAPPPLFPEWGTNGVPAYVLYKELRTYSKSKMEKYKDKEFKINGYIQNLSTSGSKSYVLNLDTDQIRMEIPLHNVDFGSWQDLVQMMKSKDDRDDSKKAKKDAITKSRRNQPQGEFERIQYGSDKVYLTAYVRVLGVKTGRLILADAKKVMVKGLGRRITLDD